MSSLTKKQKENGLIALAVVFLLAISAYAYFMVYTPAKEARLMAEQTFKSEREVLMALQEQVKALPEEERVSTAELQQRVSVEPLSELIVLQLEQAELLSRSQVKSLQIAESPLELLTPVEGIENVQKIQTTVAFETDDYAGITKFIKEIESMKRILIIDSIDFASNGEVTTVEAEDDILEVTLSFSAFYRPDLIALADTLPKVDAPPPANKVDPLPKNDGVDLAKAEDKDEASDVEVDVDVMVDGEASAESNDQVAGTQTAKAHKVVKGDTLFSISEKYYGDRSGVDLIRKANNMTDYIVKTGTTLTIPEKP
ncbi:LysM peptidoglycan-binding domain-containing protein [Planococcus halotolerans]|uniref:LysM peptidoglycan-binding domain-containing protein n=1 Tax=Planococcus halotolerans TaxID=2233542 RepID=UPI001091A8D9|nr:LysM domain-containing protein [Planococcus halotolerans]QHJ71585.1 LysM peptidoglycan-binding domain-containing protein [Planococcus halotolerans]